MSWSTGDEQMAHGWHADGSWDNGWMVHRGQWVGGNKGGRWMSGGWWWVVSRSWVDGGSWLNGGRWMMVDGGWMVEGREERI